MTSVSKRRPDIPSQTTPQTPSRLNRSVSPSSHLTAPSESVPQPITPKISQSELPPAPLPAAFKQHTQTTTPVQPAQPAQSTPDAQNDNEILPLWLEIVKYIFIFVVFVILWELVTKVVCLR